LFTELRERDRVALGRTFQQDDVLDARALLTHAGDLRGLGRIPAEDDPGPG